MGRLIRGLVAVALCLAILAPSAAWARRRDVVDRKKDPKGDEVLSAVMRKQIVMFSLRLPSWQPVFWIGSKTDRPEHGPKDVASAAKLQRQGQSGDQR